MFTLPESQRLTTIEKVIYALALVALIAGFSYVSCMSYADEMNEAKFCADMVSIGAWPEEACK